MRLIDAGSGRVLIEVDEPRGPLRRMRGLLGAADLPAGYGMLLRARHVHTIGMSFAIDAVYLSKQGSVLRVTTLPPGSIGPLVLSARFVLELKAGEAHRLGISTGTMLVREE
ncbi:MAG: DUF192 domain-containing protein [Candidatus Methylomirabilales bacterium]